MSVSHCWLAFIRTLHRFVVLSLVSPQSHPEFHAVFWRGMRNWIVSPVYTMLYYAQMALNFSWNSFSISSSTSYTRQSLSVTPRGRENVGAFPGVLSSSNSANPLSTSIISSSRSTSASFDAFVSSCSIAPRTVVSESMKSSNKYLGQF